MKFFLIIFLLLFLNQCSKPKTVLICGNHVCVNKAEAELFFEENLSIEVQIVDKRSDKQIDLVQLNLKNGDKKNKQINIERKNETDEDVKILNNAEIEKIKKNIYKKKRHRKIAKVNNKNKLYEKKIKKIKNDVVDICTIIEECNIDSISKYLLELGKKNKFPDITIRK